MRRLTIMRHAKSSWGEAELRDFDRPLNERGRAAAEAVGRELRRRGANFDLVIASPALRVRETLERFEEGYGEALEPQFEPAIYAASLETLLGLVRALPEDCASVLLVGHNPGLQQLVLALAGQSAVRDRVAQKFPTAAVAVIRLGGDSWGESGEGELELIVPRELERGAA